MPYIVQREHGHLPAFNDKAKEAIAHLLRFNLRCLAAEVCIDMFRCGIFTMMLIRYFTLQETKRDPWWTRTVVILMSVMCFTISGYVNYYVSYHFIPNWNKYTQFFEVDLLCWFPLIDTLSGSLAQGFFAYRAFRLTNRNWIILILGGIGGAIATTIVVKDISSLLTPDRGVVSHDSVFGCMRGTIFAIMLADLLITGAILYGLHRSRTGWSHTETAISRLTRITMECQAPPLILALAFVIQFNIISTSYLGAVFLGIQSKLYAFSLLYTLNTRAVVNRHFSIVNVLSGTAGHAFSGVSHTGVSQAGGIQVNVAAEQDTVAFGQRAPEKTVDWDEEIGDGDTETIRTHSIAKANAILGI